MKTGIELIAEERATHPARGYDNYHDEDHDHDEIAMAAVCYATPAKKRVVKINIGGRPDYVQGWPWDMQNWKPTPNDRVRELVKAGALIAAEIDRINAIKKK